MLGRFFREGSFSAHQGAVPGAYQIEEEGLCYALSLADDDASWPVAAYLDQLFEEDYASQLSDRWLLPWESIYQLLDDPEHASSLPLLGLPAIANLQPQLASTGGLSDPDFKVFIRSWRNPQTGNLITFERVGAVARYAETTELLSRAVWELLKAIRDLHATSSRPLEKSPTRSVGPISVNWPNGLVRGWTGSSTRPWWSNPST